MSYIVRPVNIDDLDRLLEFTDLCIGQGYFSRTELLDKIQNSIVNEITTSFVLEDPSVSELLGVRLSFAPGKWQKGKGQGLSPDLWGFSINETGYFQSLFLHPKVQARGLGGELSRAAIQALKKLGAKAVVCHAWVESPNNSSVRYLQKLGFQRIKQYPKYWFDVDYECTRCGKPCVCTAEEMLLKLD